VDLLLYLPLVCTDSLNIIQRHDYLC